MTCKARLKIGWAVLKGRDVTDQCFDRLGSLVIGLGQAVDGLVELTGFKPCYCVREAH